MNDPAELDEPKSIQAVSAETRAAGFTMASDPLACSLLRTLAASKPGGRFLELGSGTGRTHLGEDSRLTVVCADGDEFLSSLNGQHFDFIFADTWSGKYRLLEEALALVSPSGLYVIDDMLPQPNWPEGHSEKVARLVSTLEQRRDFRITKMSWAGGIILASRL